MAQKQPNVTKADLIDEISGRTGMSKADIRKVLETFLQLVKESLLAGMPIQIRGFGTFFRKKRASKKARNINKGIVIDIPAHEVPAYKPSQSFVESIKNS